MTRAIRIAHGNYGRIALLEMDTPLVRHVHPHIHVLFKIEGGDQKFVVRDREFDLTDNNAILVNPWSAHSYPHEKKIGSLIGLVLYIEPEWLLRIDQTNSWNSTFGFFPEICVQTTSQIRSKVRAIADELTFNMRLCSDYIDSLVFDVMAEYLGRYSTRNKQYTTLPLQYLSNDYRIRRALQYMRDKRDKPLNINQLASNVGLSRTRFFELFQEKTLTTPSMYANALKIESLIDQITSTDKQLVDISTEYGFKEQSNFTRFFRQHMGIPPAAYRKIATNLLAD